MEHVELLVGLAEMAIAMAGFTGVVVAFGSRSHGSWHPGDRLRLTFLLESSLTAAGFSLLALLALSSVLEDDLVWRVMSAVWALFMVRSIWSSHRKISQEIDAHADIDKWSNRLTGALFWLLVVLQVLNSAWWAEFYIFLAALMLNLAGAGMQFARLIRSAFHN